MAENSFMTAPGAGVSNIEETGLTNGKRLVFVAGLHRSGTSLVYRCLSDHSRISGFKDTGVPEDEGQHLQSVYKPAAAFGGAGSFGFNDASFMDEHSPLVSSANAHQLLEEWGRHWDMSKPYLAEKSPPNLVRTRFLQALFPDCHFIVILRHPIAVGYATQKWRPRGTLIGNLIEHWLVCHERFERDRPYLRNVHVLKYEDFMANPQSQFDAICGFLGIGSEPLRREIRPEISDRYFGKWRKRRGNLATRWYTNQLIRNFERRVAQFGYSLIDGFDS
jgi:hypothetical protein